MRRMLCVMAATAIAGVSALAIAPPSKALPSHDWFAASVTLVPAGHAVVATGTVTNVDTMAHTGKVLMKLTGPHGLVYTLNATVSLAPGASYTLRMPDKNFWYLMQGTYTVTLSSDHVLQRNDPIGFAFVQAFAQATITV